MSKATPGPWQWVDAKNDEVWNDGSLVSASLRTVEKFGKSETVERDGKHYTSFALPKFIIDCECIGGDDETDANARLIAAAPELLAVAQKIKAHGTISSTWYDELEAAIAKATGETL